jgi:hypothetical protein
MKLSITIKNREIEHTGMQYCCVSVANNPKMLSVVTLFVVMLNVIMLNVVAPFYV